MSNTSSEFTIHEISGGASSPDACGLGGAGRMLAEQLAVARRTRLQALVSAFAAKLRPGHPRVLELGCGHGHFLTAYGQAFPEHDCLGLDYSRGRIEKACRKVERQGIANVCFLRGSAEDLLTVVPAQIRFSRVFILFPDPWPKRKHRKYRMLRPAFLSALAAVVTSEAELYFRTDHLDYFTEATRVVSEHPSWILGPATAWPFEHRTVFQAKAPRHYSLQAFRTEPARQ